MTGTRRVGRRRAPAASVPTSSAQVAPATGFAGIQVDVATLMDSIRRVRRGLDPEQVADLLAAQAEQHRRELAVARDEADRARKALTQWQSEHVACQARPDGRSSQSQTLVLSLPYPGSPHPGSADGGKR